MTAEIDWEKETAEAAREGMERMRRDLEAVRMVVRAARVRERMLNERAGEIIDAGEPMDPGTEDMANRALRVVQKWEETARWIERKIDHKSAELERLEVTS